jgi:hypothetical protein
VAITARVGTAPETLIPALRDRDEAIAAQAAGFCRTAGRGVRDPESSRLLATVLGSVRRGFTAFAATLPGRSRLFRRPLPAAQND